MISESSLRNRLKIFGVSKPYLGIDDIKQFPSARISDAGQSEAYKWCQDQFGENWIWSSPIHTWWTDIYFLNKQDAVLFKLRFNTLTLT
jgi:hypothetical protein